MPDLWQKDSAESLVWISQITTPQWSLMLVVVARMLIENLKGKVVDSDNAFLNGDLEHEIYMKIPEWHDEVINKNVDKEDCLIYLEGNLWIGSSSKTILEENC